MEASESNEDEPNDVGNLDDDGSDGSDDGSDGSDDGSMA